MPPKRPEYGAGMLRPGPGRKWTDRMRRGVGPGPARGPVDGRSTGRRPRYLYRPGHLLSPGSPPGFGSVLEGLDRPRVTRRIGASGSARDPLPRQLAATSRRVPALADRALPSPPLGAPRRLKASPDYTSTRPLDTGRRTAAAGSHHPGANRFDWYDGPPQPVPDRARRRCRVAVGTDARPEAAASGASGFFGTAGSGYNRSTSTRTAIIAAGATSCRPRQAPPAAPPRSSAIRTQEPGRVRRR